MTMIDYDLQGMLRGSARARFGFKRRIVLQAPAISLGAERGYLSALRKLLRELLAAVRQYVLPNYRPGVLDALVADVGETWWDLLRQVKDRLVAITQNTVSSILNLEARRHTTEFITTAKKALGIDLGAVVRQTDLDDFLRLASQRNANLIQNLATQTISRIQELTTQSVLNGESSAVLYKRLMQQFGLSERRAKLIARDQIGKLTSDLNRARQQQAGITKYRWATSLDERVRKLHQSLEGQEYEWGEPTGAEDGLPPGQPIQCRCLARPIIEF